MAEVGAHVVKRVEQAQAEVADQMRQTTTKAAALLPVFGGFLAGVVALTTRSLPVVAEVLLWRQGPGAGQRGDSADRGAPVVERGMTFSFRTTRRLSSGGGRICWSSWTGRPGCVQAVDAVQMSVRVQARVPAGPRGGGRPGVVGAVGRGRGGGVVMAVTQNDLGSQSHRFVTVAVPSGRVEVVDFAALTDVVREIVQREVRSALADRERRNGVTTPTGSEAA